jgi:hypothetical protein
VDARHRRQVYAVCARQTAKAGHDELYAECSFYWPHFDLARAEGLAFGEDRMPKDSTSMTVQWSADRKLEVI